MKKDSKKTPIIALAILCALGTHMFLFTDVGHRLQSSAVESLETHQADTFLVIENNTLTWRINRDIPDVTNINATFLYDNESLVITQGASQIGSLDEGAQEWGKNITLSTNTPTDIKKGTILGTWHITTIVPKIHTINLLEGHATSEGNDILLSTRGTGEF